MRIQLTPVRRLAAFLLASVSLLTTASPASAQAVATNPTVTYNAIWCMAWQESYNNWARSYFGRAQFNGGFPWTDPVSHDLMAQALSHSVWMADTGRLDHAAPAGVGQNIAMQFGSDPVTSCVNGEVWLINSPEHLTNMLNPHFTEQGAGAWEDTAGSWWFTHDFK